MKEYIRTTHNFDNETREWNYRGDRSEDKFKQWNDPEVRDKLDFRPIHPRQWSFGVHALRRDQWMGMNWIVDGTIGMYEGHASDATKEFLEFVKNNPNHREIIQQHIEEEFKLLVELDMVRVRERA
jgi:hypothetical protein